MSAADPLAGLARGQYRLILANPPLQFEISSHRGQGGDAWGNQTDRFAAAGAEAAE